MKFMKQPYILSKLIIICLLSSLIGCSPIENNLDKVKIFDNILKIHLGEEKTMKFLNSFYPYILFKTMLGNKLTPPQNIDISVAVPAINYPDFIKVKIDLKIS